MAKPKPQAITKSQICRPNIITDTILVKNISQIEKGVWKNPGTLFLEKLKLFTPWQVS